MIDYAQKGLEALELAEKDALERATRFRTPVPVWENGTIRHYDPNYLPGLDEEPKSMVSEDSEKEDQTP